MMVENYQGYSIVKFDRPEKLNALDLKSRMDLISTLNKINSDPRIRAVIITGEGRGFCVDADVNELPQDISKDLRETFYPIVNEIRFSDKIYIAAINGVTAGACIGIALAADFRFAKKGVRFVTAFQRLGLTSDTGVAYFLGKFLGPRAFSLSVLGGEFTSEEAESWGLLKVVDDPLQESIKLAQSIANGPYQSYVAGKKLINKVLFSDLNEFLEYESSIQGYLGKTKDYSEGVKSFKEKREPKFVGE
ncbi:MAG: enoyl-CoA hydratase-related protein [Candidatus Aramenus sulfurataquae]|jgi:enoyl-CoA hydratase/carnithine racemase|uniref:Enoyl-CoA hydratase n=3 Tax=Candidatus Aramenus sulfurataquae TaxID=1326980 RepID=A0A0F2LR80_9CREN|nr:enoyl-CoA hydratase-related protein [Candidatus Aramenus sulfurataquae]